MNHELEVAQSVLISANTDKVWEGLTNPEIIKEYLYGTQTITDWKVGSDIVFQGEYNGHVYKDKGIVRENKTNELLSYSYWSGFSGTEDKPENYSLVTYKLKPVGTSTEFTWIQKGFANEDGYNHSKEGMSEFLKKVKEVLEK